MNPFRESLRVIGVYIRAQFLIAGLVTLLYLDGFALARVPFWFLAALFGGALQLVPKVGSLLALASVEFICWAANYQDQWRLGWVLAIWVAVQTLEMFVFSPRILGRPLGLKPLAVSIAVLAGSLLLGPIGFVIAVPVLAVANVFWRYFRRRRLA